MSGDRYHIDDQHAIYFLTFTVVEWVDVFTRADYKLIITDSFNYCIKEKGLECFAWVLMSNHLHLVVRATPPNRLSDIIRDLKKFTSKKIIDTIKNINESRREWLLHQFAYSAHSTGRAEQYKIWQDSNHAVCLDEKGDWLAQQINYVHQNLVRQMIVADASDYLFSSACDYEGRKGLVSVMVAL